MRAAYGPVIGEFGEFGDEAAEAVDDEDIQTSSQSVLPELLEPLPHARHSAAGRCAAYSTHVPSTPPIINNFVEVPMGGISALSQHGAPPPPPTTHTSYQRFNSTFRHPQILVIYPAEPVKENFMNQSEQMVPPTFTRLRQANTHNLEHPKFHYRHAVQRGDAVHVECADVLDYSAVVLAHDGEKNTLKKFKAAKWRRKVFIWNATATAKQTAKNDWWKILIEYLNNRLVDLLASISVESLLPLTSHARQQIRDIGRTSVQVYNSVLNYVLIGNLLPRQLQPRPPPSSHPHPHPPPPSNSSSPSLPPTPFHTIANVLHRIHADRYLNGPRLPTDEVEGMCIQDLMYLVRSGVSRKKRKAAVAEPVLICVPLSLRRQTESRLLGQLCEQSRNRTPASPRCLYPVLTTDCYTFFRNTTSTTAAAFGAP